MNLISRQELEAKKSSDTLVICGSGHSINDITTPQWAHIDGFDSIGFNWFLKSRRPTTFYFLREQAIFGPGHPGETRQDITKAMNSKYSNSLCIAADLSDSRKKWKRKSHYGIPGRLDRFENDGVMLSEVDSMKSYSTMYPFPDRADRQEFICDKMDELDLFDDGIFYDFCTMAPLLHIATRLRYSRILFIGVDLYDHRYFWLPRNQTRLQTRQSGRTVNQQHHVGDFTKRMVAAYKNRFPETTLLVHNARSLLAEEIGVWEG